MNETEGINKYEEIAKEVLGETKYSERRKELEKPQYVCDTAYKLLSSYVTIHKLDIPENQSEQDSTEEDLITKLHNDTFKKLLNVLPKDVIEQIEKQEYQKPVLVVGQDDSLINGTVAYIGYKYLK